MNLNERECVPCKGGVPPLEAAPAAELLAQLGSGWSIVDHHHLQKTYTFANFSEGLAYVNRVGELAEQQHHHPDIYLAWGEVELLIWTHKIDGLTESDFIFAAKCDAL
ncbi:MAG: 4a-hydroxytetrahydrobiopterin dehydratase [Vulcanimicrobiaceae bacterium]